VVVGDIVILDAGDYIPADIRIIESMNLKIDESALTGESMPVEKDADAILESDVSLGDRINLASMGTVVTYGRGTGVVYATGMNTEMGKIATILSETIEATTPLQGKLNAMAKTLGIACIVICAIIFGVGYLYGMNLVEMLMVSVSLAVAAVPEGVAIVATVILAIGIQKMVKSKVLVKKLRAVETLGSTTVICSDKTGTLTQNKMTVVKIFDAESEYEVTGTGYAGEGEVVAENRPITKNITLMAEIAVLCNDSVYDKQNAKIIGDPTEAAMLVFGAKMGLDKDSLDNKYKRVQEIPFDSDRN
jgi:Ca2+-transporting ATPase